MSDCDGVKAPKPRRSAAGRVLAPPSRSATNVASARHTCSGNASAS